MVLYPIRFLVIDLPNYSHCLILSCFISKRLVAVLLTIVVVIMIDIYDRYIIKRSIKIIYATMMFTIDIDAIN
jgi:hypothetical protein